MIVENVRSRRASHSLLAGASALLLVAACADTSYKVADARADAARDGGGDKAPELDWGSLDVPPLPDGFEIGRSVVFAHDAASLYELDPDTLAVKKLADFIWPGEADKMTDLAVDRDGKMLGVSGTRVYSVDPVTGQCTELSQLDAGAHFVGLSFVTPDWEAPDFLVGIDKADGKVERIDPETGRSTLIGTFGNGLLASGDIVSVKGFGTVATVIDGESPTDLLAHVDVATGKATVIGETGFKETFGLGYWKGKLYAFTTAGEVVQLDPTTGKGTVLQADTGVQWWGAAVTTAAPVID